MPDPTKVINNATEAVRGLLHQGGAKQLWPNPNNLYDTLGACADLCVKLDSLRGLLHARLRSLAAEGDLYTTSPRQSAREVVLNAVDAMGPVGFDSTRRALDHTHSLMASVGRKI